jgi:hypothetical protein
MTEAARQFNILFKFASILVIILFALKFVCSQLGWFIVFLPFVLLFGLTVCFVLIYWITIGLASLIWLNFVRFLDWAMRRSQRKE